MLIGISSSTKKPSLLKINQDTSLSEIPISELAPLFRHSSALVIEDEDECIFVSGGIDNSSKIQGVCFSYNTISKSLKPYPPLNTPRFAHCSVIFKGSLYILGGRAYGPDQISLLNSAEIFDEGTLKWKNLGNMIKRRCSFASFIYCNRIFVIGGYSDLGKRTRTIEFYDEESKSWQKYKFKLAKGIESCSVFPLASTSDCILIVGGYTNAGDMKSTWIFNLKNGSTLFAGNMSVNRVLHKGFLISNTEFVIFGGDSQNSLEIGKQGNDGIFKFEVGRKLKEDLHALSEAKRTLIIESDALSLSCSLGYSPSNEIKYIFGNDEEPFALAINFSNSSFKILPIPPNLLLLAYQGVTRVPGNKIFFCGGITKGMDKVSKLAFLLDLESEKVEILPKMNYPRYAHSLISSGNDVFVIGGRYSQGSDSSLLSANEVFNLETKSWKCISPLKSPKCSVALSADNEKIYSSGGYIGSGCRTNEIEVFNKKIESWSILSQELIFPVEAGSSFLNQNKIFYVGGFTKEGFSNKIMRIPLNDESPSLLNNDLGFGRFLFKSFSHSTRTFILGGASPPENVKEFLLSFDSEFNEKKVEDFGLKMIEILLKLGADCELKSYSSA